MRRIYVDQDENNWIKKIDFYSPSQGYVAFTYWIGFTTDSGRTFQRKYIDLTNVDYNGYFPNLTFGFGINGVKAFDQNHLVVYGDYGFMPSILYSSDGGNTFKLIYYHNLGVDHLTDGVVDMTFPQDNISGYAVEENRVLKTIDGGRTWSVIKEDANSYYVMISGMDNNNLFLETTKPALQILKSTNSGNSWQPMNVPESGSGVFYFLSPQKGWMHIYPGRWYYTSDGAASWKLMNSDQTLFASGQVRFVNDSTGYALGDEYNVYKTSDSGKIWEPLPRSDHEYTGFNHFDLYFWNVTQFWAGGYHGLLEMTTNGGGNALPKAFFRIDTSNLYLTHTVNLINLSKPNHQFKWFKNDTLISTSYNFSYLHNTGDSFDLIKLVALDGINSDTLLIGQYFNVPPPPPIPTITSFTPTSGPEGTVVTINGTNFKNVSSVTFGGSNAVTFTVVSPNVINAVVGKGTSGNVSVTTQYGTATLSGFVFTTQLKITSFNPTQGPAGTVVTINGTEFSPTASDNVVYFGAVRAQVLTATTSQLTVVVPLGQSYRPVTVTTNGLTAYASQSFLLTFPTGDSITKYSFPRKIDSTADGGAYYLKSADFDNDGKPDVVTTNFSYYLRIGIHRNTSINDSISFESVKYFNLGTGLNVSYTGIALGDMNGDGKIDIIAQGNSRLVYLRNTSSPGNISFAPFVELNNTLNYAPEFFDITDLDGDGKPEPFGVAGTSLGTFKNVSVGDSIAIATAGYYKLSESTYGLNSAAADLDGDRKPEIVFSAIYNHNWALYVYRNASNGGIVSFSPIIIPVSCPYGQVAIGDFDKDGKQDIAVTGTNGVLTILRNTSSNGTISFAPRIDYSLPLNATSVSVGDLNGDGQLDVIVNLRGNLQMAILENKSTLGTINFGAPIVLSLVEPLPASDIFLADYNLDGKLDIASVAQRLTILLNQSGTTRIQVCDHNDTTLSTNIIGTNYQWQENTGSGFVNISDNGNFSGANTALLHISNISQSWLNYQFRCIIDNKPDKVYSLDIRSVLTPSVQISSSDTSICFGKTVSFVSSALNVGGSPNYQWMLNNSNIGTNLSTLNLNNLNDNDKVSLKITTPYACATSSSALSNEILIHVKPNPVANAGIDQTICKGQSATIGSNVNGDSYSWKSSLGGFSSSQPGITVSPSSTTVYYLTVTNSYSCSVTDTVVVNVSAAIANAGPDKTICSGSLIGTTIGFLSIPNSTYSWSPSTGLSSPTAAQPFANPSTTTIYVLTVISTPLNCSAKDTVVVNVVQNLQTPTISASGATTFCQGGNVKLTSSASSGNQWYKDGSVITNETNSLFVATSQGSYTVKYTSGGCTSDFSSPVSVTVTQGIAAPTISHSGNTTFCQGQNITLTSSASSGNQWYKDGVSISGANNQTYVASQSGTYTVGVTQNGCSSQLSSGVSIVVNPIPSTPTISVNGNVLTSSASTGNQWYLNNAIIQGATNNTYTATTSGDYTVKVTSNGCNSTSSSTVTISITAVNSPNLSKEIIVAPNPVKNTLTIWYTGTASSFHLNLFDVFGKVILHDQKFTSSYTIDMSKYARGVYVLQIINSRGETSQRTINKL